MSLALPTPTKECKVLFDELDEPGTLVSICKYATLKSDSGRFAGRSVPRGVDNILAHWRS